MGNSKDTPTHKDAKKILWYFERAQPVLQTIEDVIRDESITWPHDKISHKGRRPFLRGLEEAMASKTPDMREAFVLASLENPEALVARGKELRLCDQIWDISSARPSIAVRKPMLAAG